MVPADSSGAGVDGRPTPLELRAAIAAGMAANVAGAWDVRLASTRVVFGEHALERLGELTLELGARRVLVVTDPGIRRAGHVERAVASLVAAGVTAHVFEDVEQNPTTRHVEAGVHVARSEQIDGLIGLGGGSAMDCAKGINFVLTGGGKMEDYWGKGKANGPMLPSLGVPTTAGTGSEAQSFALIAQAGTGIKMACGDQRAAFRTVVLDPALTVSVPRDVVAAAGVDAITHAIESYVSRAANPLSRLFAREAWRLLALHLPEALCASAGLEARAGMLLGSFLAGGAIELSMLGAAHACANPLTARFGVIHGHAVGLMLPHVMRLNAPRVRGLYQELSAADAGSDGTALVDRFCELRALAGLPETLRSCAVIHEHLLPMAGEAAAQWTADFNPVPAGEHEMLRLYEAAY